MLSKNSQEIPPKTRKTPRNNQLPKQSLYIIQLINTLKIISAKIAFKNNYWNM